MSTYSNFRGALPLAACLVALHPVSAMSATTQSVTLHFAGEFGSQAVDCASARFAIGLTPSPVVVNDYRLYVSEVALIDAAGERQPVTLEQDGAWQSGTVALLDFENGQDHCANGTREMRDKVTGSVPPGDYRGVAFTLGVPFDRNHADPTLADSPLNLTSMFWNWRGGYKFLRIDMSTTDAQPGTGWFLHLGSTLCQSDAKTRAPSDCRNGNRVTVVFEDFDIAHDTVVIDPAPVLAASDLSINAPDTSPGCMSFPDDSDCHAPFARLGLAYDGTDAGSDGQQLFRVRAGAR